jgi:hypothetical protein
MIKNIKENILFIYFVLIRDSDDLDSKPDLYYSISTVETNTSYALQFITTNLSSLDSLIFYYSQEYNSIPLPPPFSVDLDNFTTSNYQLVVVNFPPPSVMIEFVICKLNIFIVIENFYFFLFHFIFSYLLFIFIYYFYLLFLFIIFIHFIYYLFYLIYFSYLLFIYLNC